MGCCDGCFTSKESKEPLQYDPDFKGPTHNRTCTDILWLIVFILFLGAWGYVGYYSMSRGSLEKILAPIDSRGRRCGVHSGLEEKKYLIFFNIAKCLAPGSTVTGCPTTQVCVSQCPQKTVLFKKELAESPSSFEELRNDMVCTEDVNIQTMTHAQALQYFQEEKCASFVIQSQPVLGRCFVNVTATMEVLRDITDGNLDMVESEVLEQLTNLFRFDQLSSQIVQDLVRSRWYMAGALVAVVLLCLLYIFLLRWVIATVVWASIAGLFALIGFGIYLCIKNYTYYKANPQARESQSIFTSYEVWLVTLIVLAAVLVILILVIAFLRNRIVLAIALIREGSKAVTSIKSTVLFPILPWIFQCAVIAYGILVLMFLLSVGESDFRVVNLQNDTACSCGEVYTEDHAPCDPQTFATKCLDTSSADLMLPCQLATCHFNGIENPNSVIYMQLINVFGFFWAMFFIGGVSDMILAGAFSAWYWTFHKNDIRFFTLTTAIYRTLRYHLGTVAFGALIIAIVRVVRTILEFIDNRVKKFDNPFSRCIMCFCQCMLWCLENFLQFINKNTYIMCAIHGKNFCSSARATFSLIIRNIFRVVVLDKVANFIFLLSKLLITVGVGFAVYYLLEWNYVYEVTKGERLHYNYIPAIILSVAAYLICTVFFNVYSMAVDTLFLCFLEDCERNDGSPDKPYYMSKNLMRILGKSNLKTS